MRFIFLLFIVTTGLCSCTNDLATIGQDLIDNGNHIELQTTILNETGTIKLDSFITSSGRYGRAITKMYMGRYEDEYSGTTVAAPCFQLVPAYRPSIASRYALDSVTFHFSYGGDMWGDTISTPRVQTYSLWQLAELPTLDTDDNNFFYNVSPISWGRRLAEVSFIPKQKYMKYAYFKLPNNDFTEDLFQKMKDGDQIFKPTSGSTISYYKFMAYFKGLAIRSADDNNCLMSILTIPDSLYMRFHYHDAEVKYSFDLKLLNESNDYQYYTVHNQPVAALESLRNQKDEVKYSTSKLAIVQGLSGYMIKINIPEPEIPYAFKTVVKAEIEIKPRSWASPAVALPSNISVYYTNKINEIKDLAYNNTNNPIVGKYVKNLNNSNDDRYIFDVTDYYQNLVALPSSLEQRQLLLTVPNPTSSFDRMMLKDTPVLNVYYATYKD